MNEEQVETIVSFGDTSLGQGLGAMAFLIGLAAIFWALNR